MEVEHLQVDPARADAGEFAELGGDLPWRASQPVLAQFVWLAPDGSRPLADLLGRAAAADDLGGGIDQRSLSPARSSAGCADPVKGSGGVLDAGERSVVLVGVARGKHGRAPLAAAAAGHWRPPPLGRPWQTRRS